jgi:hypothetical protein
LLICEKPLAAFSLKPKAQRKSFQKETPKKVSRSAEREEGCAPSTARAFEKARPKLLSNRQALSAFSAVGDFYVKDRSFATVFFQNFLCWSAISVL